MSLIASFLLGGCSIFNRGSDVEATPVESVRVTLANSSSETVGEALLRQTVRGVLITLDLSAVPPGTHAMHIHSVGQCDPPAFDSAGDHFNPAGRSHGALDPQGMHAGDLPNVHAPESGRLRVDVLVENVMLAGGENGLFDADGSSLVIHTFADDYRTDPSGNAGSRIACGVIGP
ncbi:MAG: superoxide dismutase family protein [Gemmatimonadaceae bacterium]